MSLVDTVRILVVEDEPDIRMMVRAVLAADPRTRVVGEAVNGQDAIELVRNHDPGLIILDHSIEGDVMGLQAAPLLKEVAPSAKILLFTAFDMRKDAQAEPAVDAFLEKSDVGALLPVVRRLLGLGDP